MSLLPAILSTSLPQPQSFIPHQNPKKQSTSLSTNPPINRQVDLKSFDPAVPWTSSISRRCRAGQLAEAAEELTNMRLAGIEPNHVTYMTLISGIADFPSKGGVLGSQIHGYVSKLGLDRKNVMVGTALLQMYTKSGCPKRARMVFEYLGEKNAFSWNTMIDGCVRDGDFESALELFDEMPERDVITWTSLMNGFIKKGHPEEALALFREMIISGTEPDHVATIAAISAATNLGVLGIGLWLHRFVMEKSFRDNIRVNNALIVMYSRCGCIDFARQVFEKMPKRTTVSWNCIINGFAVNGLANEALEHFNLMLEEGFEPDGFCFTGALTACSHAGLVNEGLRYFDIMKRVRKISPRIEHYGCLVDLYSRAGKLKEALNVIETMPMKPNEIILGSLLTACRTHGDVTLAESVLKHLVALKPNTDSNYVLISNIYAALGNWDGASMVRRRMKDLGIQKSPGVSSIEIASEIHEFISSDKSHSDTEQIYNILELLSFDLKLSGYVPETITRESQFND